MKIEDQSSAVSFEDTDSTSSEEEAENLEEDNWSTSATIDTDSDIPDLLESDQESDMEGETKGLGLLGVPQKCSGCDPKYTITDFIDSFERFAVYKKLAKEQQKSTFRMLLEQGAARFFDSLEEGMALAEVKSSLRIDTSLLLCPDSSLLPSFGRDNRRNMRRYWTTLTG